METLRFSLAVAILLFVHGVAAAQNLRVLVTNDDGVRAPGIDALVQELTQNPNLEVIVIAPAMNQSGTADNFTNGALGVAAGSTASGFPGKAVSGFPADTVLYGVLRELDPDPDLVVSGINAGQNIALYPEGGCKGRRLFHEFKSGAFEVSIRTGVPILPVFLHYEAQDDFEWQPPYTLPDKIQHIAFATNNRANYYVYDVLDPKDYADKYAMKAAAYELYKRWNAQYLE